jgi:putative oxidoreductase
MKTFLRLIQLDFLPRSGDFALLLLRVWLGLTMLLNHGWAKAAGFSEKAEGFADPLGVGTTTSLVLAIFGEVVCSTLLVLGLLGRFAAAVLIMTMGVAFCLVHRMALSGEFSGELAFIYLAGFVALFLAGPGRYSLDTKLGLGRSK